MSRRSLEQLLQDEGNPVTMLRNSQVGAYIYPVVPPEFTNWRDEQRAWQQDCVLYDQSHHMASLTVKGKDAEGLLNRLAVNTFRNFGVNKAKQYVPCSYDGKVIGDGILFHHEEEQYEFVGRVPTVNWIQFHAETGDRDVELIRDDRSPSRPMGKPVTRRLYRYQIQGPKAEQLLERLHGGPLPDIKFFNIDHIMIGARRIPALRHGMAGQPGLEIWGPYEEGEEVRAQILEAGEEFGVVPSGNCAYSTNALESGWIPSPLPAVYTGEQMKAYREWLSEDSYEGRGGSIGGSFVSDDIEDYYLTPHDLGYASLVRFDHDFVGRDALERIEPGQHRQKVTLAWNGDDVAKVFASLFSDDVPYKCIDLPQTNYASANYDMIVDGDELVGFSMFTGYSYNERTMLSLSTVDAGIEIGAEVGVIWGEPDGGTLKTTVERPHRQIAIRATVGPAPYVAEVREKYRPR